MLSQPASLGHHTALGSPVASGLTCAESAPLQSTSSSSSPCHAVPCHAMLGATASRQGGVTGCLAEGARPCSCGRGPSLCMGTSHAVLLRSSSARGMIDLVSASGGLSQCQASA